MKKVLYILTILLFFISVFPLEAYSQQSFQASSLQFEIEGKQVQLTKPILIVNGRSLLPMRDFFELCGAKVSWDNENRMAVAEKEGHKVVFPIDSQLIAVDGRIYGIDVPATIINDSTYIPIRAAGESLGFNVRWLPERKIQIGKSVVPDGKVLKPYNPEAVFLGNYDRQWYQNDRNHFAQLLRIAKTCSVEAKKVIYEEYLTLIRQREKIDVSAYRSKRGYTIYSPDITDKLNTLEIAIQARSLLLRDIEFNQVKGLDNYYEKNYLYLINWSDNEISKKSESVVVPEIIPARYINFDQRKIASVLDSLPIPNAIFYGLKIWYINGYPKNINEAGFYRPGPIGNFNGGIVVYNSEGLTPLEITLHEVGHGVDRVIFQHNSQDPDILDNQVAVRQYVSIYGKQIYDDKGSCGNKVAENFAEDFMNLFGGYKKHPDVWQGEHKKEVQNFINSWLPKADLSEFYLAGYSVTTSEGTFTHFQLPYSQYAKAETFVTKDRKIDVDLQGIGIENRNLEVVVVPGGSNVSEEDILFFEGKDSKCHIEFPNKGVYEVQIWLNGQYISPGFNFYVVYGDYNR